MSTENDLALAYHMGYDDALAKRKPDASKAQVLAPHDLAIENAKLRELCGDLFKGFDCGWPSDVCGDCERDGMGMPIGGCKLENRARELGIKVD